MQDQGDLDFRLPCPLLSVELFNKISSDLRQWARAFAPLYSRERDYDSLHFLNASFICIQALSSDITLRGMHFGEKGLRTKSVEKLADRIVNVAQLIVSHPRFHKKFTCETGIIAALCSVSRISYNKTFPTQPGSSHYFPERPEEDILNTPSIPYYLTSALFINFLGYR